jgi:phosphoglycolate phosphatase-like HAD superfamily hydrolase
MLPGMKNANVFVDVDLTLVDAKGALLPGAREALTKLRDKGCHLFLWSTVGLAYAQAVAKRHQLEPLFEGYAAKPDIIIDDMPSTAVAPFVYDAQAEPWDSLADRIIKKHID